MTPKSFKRVVFIDRDGVINIDLWKYVEKWEEFRFEPHVLDALKILTDHGFHIIIISNQAGVGDGIFSEQAMWDIHHKMIEVMKLHGIKIHVSQYCIHGKKENCSCRKPRTGLLERGAKGLLFDPAKTFFVGDKLSDLEAGKNFGIRTILVRTGYGKETETKLTDALRADLIVDNLKEAIPAIINA